MERQEPLHLMARLETPHRAFHLPSRLVKDFGSMVGILAGVVLRSRKDVARCDPVAFELVSEQTVGGLALTIQHLANEPLGGMRIAFALYEDFEHLTVLIDSPPEIVNLTIDANEHLLAMPLVAETSFTPPE